MVELPEIGRRAGWIKTEAGWRNILLQAPGYTPRTGMRALDITDPSVRLALHVFCAAPRALAMTLAGCRGASSRPPR